MAARLFRLISAWKTSRCWQRTGPRLSWPGIALITAGLCMPFLLVEIPPLIDLPGHMGAAAIEAAGPASPLHRYFAWQWVFTLNIGGDVLLKVLGAYLGILAAGWWSAVLATALFTLGILAAIRAVNPRGSLGAGWALIYVYSFPLLTGLLNYLLAAGLALCAFAAARALESRPGWRAGLLIVAQPLAMLCHAIGGALLALLVVTHALGSELDLLAAPWRWRGLWRLLMANGALQRLFGRCWPLLATLITVACWKVLVPGTHDALLWRPGDKWWFLFLTLRDQSMLLDLASALAGYGLLLFGRRFGARWTWATFLPGITLLALYFVVPGDIGGSAFADVRLMPIALILLLGWQDWSGAQPRIRAAVAWSGLAMLLVRLAVTSVSFVGYNDAYHRQLAALRLVEPGSRVLAFVEHGCLAKSWREERVDHLASLASLYRQAWVNDNWAVPGLHMLHPRWRPSPDYGVDPSEIVAAPRCIEAGRPGLEQVLAHAPITRVDYVWLIDTGPPVLRDSHLRLIWQSQRSLLFAVNVPRH